MKKMLLINAGVLAASMIRNMMSMSLINNHYLKWNWKRYLAGGGSWTLVSKI